jgi:TM2 domain-containing membrane protein YozV
MDCVNHSGVTATSFCQNCGKALCGPCVRTAAAGQILCEPCMNAWQAYQQPFVSAIPGGPNPSAAAVLGLIPGVGAMYNGQFFKGLIHVVIFAVLVSITEYHGIFGIFIGAWVLYQSFEAYHTARALRDGQPSARPARAERSRPLAQPRLSPAASWPAARTGPTAGKFRRLHSSAPGSSLPGSIHGWGLPAAIPGAVRAACLWIHTGSGDSGPGQF